MEGTQASISGEIDKEVVAFVHRGIPLATKRGKPTTCNNMDRLEGTMLSEISHTEKNKYL